MADAATYPGFITRQGDAWLVNGEPLSSLSREALEQLATDLIDDNAALSDACTALQGRVSAGYEYRAWRAKPPEERKPGIPHFDKEGIG